MFNSYDEGKAVKHQVLFQDAALVGPFYIGLGTGQIPQLSSDGLAEVTEVTGTNYARISVPRDSMSWTVSGDTTTSIVIEFENTGTDDWSDVDYAFLTLSPSGTTAPNVLLDAAELEESLIISADETFQMRYSVKL